MARVNNTLLERGAVFSKEHLAPAVDISKGGNLGHMPRYKTMPTDTPFVANHLIIQLLTAPAFFSYLPDGMDVQMTAMLKTILERMPTEVTGFDDTVSYDFIEHDIGGGQKISRPSKATLPQANISWQFEEKGNTRSIAEFLRFYGDMGMLDPITQAPRLAALDWDALPDDNLNDKTSFSFIAIEPDAFFKYPVKVYMINGAMPKSSGDVKSKRSIVNAMEGSNFSIETTGYYTPSSFADKLGAEILRNMNRGGLDPENNMIFSQKKSADVAAADTGYMDHVEEVAGNA